MWLTPLSLVTGVSALVLPNVSPVNPTFAIDQPRDIIGLLDGDLYTSLLPNPLRTRPAVPISKGFPKTSTSPSGELTFPASQTSTNQPTSAATTNAKPADRTTYPHSSNETTAPTEPTILPVPAATHASDHTSKTWQVVGIVFISILLIATFITCAMFFDRLWRFSKDVFCGKTRSEASEEFIPDSESHSWDMTTPFPSLADLTTPCKGDLLAEKPSVNTRELPWNSNSQTWNTLHRQPSRRNDHHAVA